MLVSAVWIAPAVLATIDRVAQRRLHGEPPASAQELIWAGGDWLVYALLTPPIFAAARRWPIARPHVARARDPPPRVLPALLRGLGHVGEDPAAGAGPDVQSRGQLQAMVTAAGDQFWQKRGLDLFGWIFTTLPFGVVVYLSHRRDRPRDPLFRRGQGSRGPAGARLGTARGHAAGGAAGPAQSPFPVQQPQHDCRARARRRHRDGDARDRAVERRAAQHARRDRRPTRWRWTTN